MYERLICLLLLLASFYCPAQLQGVVVDSVTLEPIPFVHVYAEAVESGTVTNLSGEFFLDVKEQSLEITFSHVSYNNKKVLIGRDAKAWLLKLSPRTTLLQEVIVSDAGRQLAEEIYTGLGNHQAVHFGKAFYRQITFTDTVPSEFIETFHTVASDASGITKISLEQARFARAKSDEARKIFVFNNFSYLTNGFRIFSPHAAQMAKPFCSDYFDQYTFGLEGYFEKNGTRYATVSYEPSAEIRGPSLKGSFIVNLATRKMIAFNASTTSSLGADSSEVTKDGVKMKKQVSRNHHYEWQVSFRDTAEPVLEYVSVTATLDFLDNDAVRKAKIVSTLVVYERDQKRKKGLKSPSIQQKDMAAARSVKYNPRFWKNNPVIKRNASEEKAIAYFDKTNSFTNY
jgi:hypothetical protein